MTTDGQASVRRRRRSAAAKYRPRQIKLLFVAEAPPADPGRYFYFENVRQHDDLWVETMRALYTPAFGTTRDERLRKASWLRRFRDDGCFLIDALKDPIGQDATSLIRKRAYRVAREITELQPKQIVLVKKSVWIGLHQTVREHALPLCHEELIPFPGSSQQRRFREAIRDLDLGSILE